MTKTKLKLVESIIALLKPNTYCDSSYAWDDLHLGLSRMSKKELDAAYILILCKKHGKE